MKPFFKVTYVLALLTLVSCSSGQVNINSSPKGAEIQVVNKDGKITTVGTTPYKGITRDLFQDGGDFVQVRVGQTGHQPQEVLIERPMWDKSIDINFSLTRNADDTGKKGLDNLAKGIANALKDINAKKFDTAEISLLGLAKEFPEVSVVYDFLGNILYMKRDFKQAQTYYEKAASLDPNIEERNRIIQKLKILQGKE